MTFSQCLLTITLLTVVPAILGLGFFNKKSEASLSLCLVEGYIFFFAVFQVVAVPFIIKEKTLTEMLSVMLPVFGIIMAISVFFFVLNLVLTKKQGFVSERKVYFLSASEIIYLGLFLALVFFQVYKALFYVYADGDDAFYIATAQVADQSDLMYLRNPYVGDSMGLNFRYILSPFPMLTASVARLTHLKSATVAHIFLSPILILVTYLIYYEISKLLFKEDREKRYMFLFLLAIFVIFGNYSTSTAETFLLTRSRQGKEALANIILPFLFLMFLRIAEDIKKLKFTHICILVLTMLAAALTSVFANILAPLMLGLFVLYAIFRKAGYKNVILLSLPVIPNILFLLMYFVEG